MSRKEASANEKGQIRFHVFGKMFLSKDLVRVEAGLGASNREKAPTVLLSALSTI